MQRLIRSAKESSRVKKAAKARRPLYDEEQQFVNEFQTRRFDVVSSLQEKPNLATLVVPELVDASGRTFTDVPLFTYMLWTGDQNGMSLFLLDPESMNIETLATVYENLLKQLKTFKELGVTFTHDNKKYSNHAKYSDQAHIDVLKQYVKMCDDGCTLEERKEFWIQTVGKAQRMVELHIAIKLCHAEKTPSNFMSIFPSKESIAKPIWYPLTDSKLGEEYAICATSSASACEAPQPAFVRGMIQKLELFEQNRQYHQDCVEKKLKELMLHVNEKIQAKVAGNFNY